MTREDSIALADRLEKDYAKLDKLKKELHQNAKEIDRPYEPRQKMKKGERFGFNWYLVIGILSSIPFLVLALLFYVFAFASRWDHKPGEDLYQILSIVMVFLSVVVFLGVQIIGSKKTTRKWPGLTKGSSGRSRTEKRK